MSARRDFKHRATAKPRRRTRYHALVVGLLVLVGLVGIGLAWLAGYGPQPAPAPQAEAPRPAPTPAPAPEQSKPKYDFYTVLPDRQVIIPPDELTAQKPRKIQPPAQPPKPSQSAATQPAPTQPTADPAPTKGAYQVQAGAFRNYQEADRMRASLVLMGVNARIVSAADSRLHRVRVGPLSQAQAQALHRRLQQKGIQSIIRTD